MTKDEIKTIVESALKGAAASALVGVVNEALKGKTVGGKKIVLFTARK